MKYVANPVIVDAFKITKIKKKMSYTGVFITLENGEEKTCNADMIARYEPEIGDYLVIHSDGYEYFNPAHVFERKYSPVTEQSRLHEIY